MTRTRLLLFVVVLLSMCLSVCVALQVQQQQQQQRQQQKQQTSSRRPTTSRTRPRRRIHHCPTMQRTSIPPRLEEEDFPQQDNDKKVPFNRSTTVEFGRMARGVVRTGMKEVESLQVGDLVVAKVEIPSLQIWRDCGYEITAIYAQGINVTTGKVEQIPLSTLAAENDRVRPTGYTRYLQIYSARDHSEPVIVTPEEIGLVTVKAELQEAMLLAIPGFFWVVVASSFSNYYTDRYGGNFFDAFFRT